MARRSAISLWRLALRQLMTSAQSKAPSPPIRRFFIVGKLIKSGPDHHSPSFPRRPGPPRSGGLACPPSSADRQFLERGITEVKEGGSDDLSICELDADWATEVPEHGLSPALTRHFEQRGAFLYPVRFEGID
jgi:hypothetical protein